MVKTPIRNLIFCALGCTFLVHFVVVLFCFTMYTSINYSWT